MGQKRIERLRSRTPGPDRGKLRERGHREIAKIPFQLNPGSGVQVFPWPPAGPSAQRADVSLLSFFARFSVLVSGAESASIRLVTSSVISAAGSIVSTRAVFLGITILRPRSAATARSTGF